ncbi:MAG TPA: alpha/beta fold hydrolase [Verrucomicrobiae bacterium]|nr:alpha/beta fold hydrolase [Verrucomicrobiae bacterium]
MVAQKLLFALALVVGAAGTTAQTTRVVRLTTADDVGIIGTYYPSELEWAPAVLLLHDLNRDRSDWNDFASLLQSNRIAALTIDFRGHGESTRELTANGPVELKLKDFTELDLRKMLLDIEAAVDWLQMQSEIDKKHIALIGASLGANLALRYAALNHDLAGVALLSPGLNYRSIRTDDVIRQLGGMPVQIFVSHDDGYAFESSKRLIEIRQELGVTNTNKELMVCTGSLHGTPMLRGVKDFPQILLSWCRQVLSGEKPAAPTRPPDFTTHGSSPTDRSAPSLPAK